VAEDECIVVLSGSVTLVTDDGERLLTAGSAAGFPAGVANGHHLVNRGPEPATYLEIGTRSKDEDVTYPDEDLRAEKRDFAYRFLHKSGEPIDEVRRRSAEGADPCLSGDAEGPDRSGMPASADVLGLRAGSDR
jgi:uncharacterized cupin superfamily protein